MDSGPLEYRYAYKDVNGGIDGSGSVESTLISESSD